MEAHLQTICPNITIYGSIYYYNFTIYYQILSITLLKEFIELNVNSDAMIKSEKHVGLS